MASVKGGERDMLIERLPKTGLQRELRLRGIPYSRLAEEVGVQEQTVGNWAKGKTTPEPTMRKRISVILGVDIYTLFFRHEDDPGFLTPAE